MEVFRTVLKNNKKQSDKSTFKKLMTLEEIGKLKNDIFTLDRSKMLLRMFEAHGQFCASHPWEVIFVTLALMVCATSFSHVEPNLQEDDSKLILNSKTSEYIVLGVTRCVAIAYVYIQFSKLRNLGSKYLLGITGILTLVFSFCLSIAVINFFGSNLNSLSEAMPIFLLLVDLSKACTLAKFALSSKCQDEIISNIGQGMAMVGPMMTLDALVEALVIGVGTLSGVRTLQSLCCFGCLSVVANYLAFMTFYPACLTIVLELTGDHRRLVQIQQLAKVWQSDDESQKPNPVNQKVKMIMSAGLLLVHIHTRLSSSSSSFLESNIEKMALGEATSAGVDVSQNLTFWQFLFERSSGFSIDYMITIALITVLSIKYVFLDTDHSTPTDHHHHRQTSAEEPSGQGQPEIGDGDRSSSKEADKVTEDDSSRFIREHHRDIETQTEVTKNLKFFLGSDSGDEDVEDNVRRNIVDSSTQTSNDIESSGSTVVERSPRDLEECLKVFKSEEGAKGLSDEEVVMLVESKRIPCYNLENEVRDLERGVRIRRKYISRNLSKYSMDDLPYLNYDYSYVKNQCCENVIGYVPLPVGFVGPLLVNEKNYIIPMATTEGCLIASTNRGCRALSRGNGVTCVVVADAMTRAPLVKFGSVVRAAEVRAWLECPDNFDTVAEAFNGTSRFARLKKLMVNMMGNKLFVRFSAETGDAMGMNMLSKGCQAALLLIQEKYFNDMQILSLSGNFCTDKKPSALNWIMGRGKSVVSEAIVSSSVVRDVLKTDVDTLVSLNIDKNYIGSMSAGSIGGFNAHASNIVTAIFIATGQDPAQNVTSSYCLTSFEKNEDGDLYITCKMPCLEVGTVGGGTTLPPQAACLEMLGVRGPNVTEPGLNARTLSNLVCSAVMAGELSLMSALASGDLVKSHMKHNRSVASITQPCLSS